MNYGKALQKSKAARSDHRKARAVPDSRFRRELVRESKNFKSLEREHDQSRRFGGSLKSVYYDSDGDGYKDRYGKIYRGGVVDKNLEIPTFGPIDPPSSGPTGLNASQLPDAISAPTSGPSNLSASFNLPSSGPTGLEASIPAPANGPTGLEASIPAPANGPTGLEASIPAPANGPTGLEASIPAPANGPTGLEASISAPAAGPTGLGAAKLTLNINIEASQDAIVAKTPAIGTIEYASDVEYLFIYDGTQWHHTDGGNS